MTNTYLPLIRHTRLDEIAAYRHAQAIDVAQFLAELASVAAVLPQRGHVLNLCSDRFRFAVGFAAALMRQQISLLPPNHTPELIARLGDQYPDVYCLTDAVSPHPLLESVTYPEQIARGQKVPAIPAFAATQVAAHVFTSGSTGQPMPHVKTWGSLVASTLAAGARLGVSAFSGATVLGTVPPQHMYGLESTVLLPLQHGLALHAERPFYPGDIAASLEEMPRPRILVTTPVHLRALLADSAALPPVDFLLCATAPLSPQLAVAAETRFAAPLYEIYGCTEAGQVAVRRTVQGAQWVALDGIRVHQDERGTWAVGGPVEIPAPLNDVIEVQGPGRFLLHGRLADLVNVAGKRTSLAHLNYHLNSIEGVRDGVFVMPETEDNGVTRLMAFVVAPGLTAEDITAALRQRIDAAFLPRPLHLVEELPRNATGKLPREAVNRLSATVSER
jgi:acyl-coenzyme A synthetase/AMP-(fatty) acid ligase